MLFRTLITAGLVVAAATAASLPDKSWYAAKELVISRVAAGKEPTEAAGPTETKCTKSIGGAGCSSCRRRKATSNMLLRKMRARRHRWMQIEAARFTALHELVRTEPQLLQDLLNEEAARMLTFAIAHVCRIVLVRTDIMYTEWQDALFPLPEKLPEYEYCAAGGQSGDGGDAAADIEVAIVDERTRQTLHAESVPRDADAFWGGAHQRRQEYLDRQRLDVSRLDDYGKIEDMYAAAQSAQ